MQPTALHRPTGMLWVLMSGSMVTPVAAQERFLPPAQAVVLPSSVHTQGGRQSHLSALDQARRAQPQNLDAALAYGRAVFNSRSRDVQIAKGFEKGAWAQNYFVGWRGSDGERDHAESNQRSFAGKWFYTNEEGQWRAGLSTRYYKNTALEAGYLSYAEVRANPTQSPDYARDDRSERQTMQTALHADGQLGNGWSWNAKAYQNDYRNQRWVTFTAGGAQQERFNDETHRGVILNTTWRPSTALAELVLDAGVDAQWQDNLAARYRTVARERQTTLRDWRFDLDTQGAYVQAVVKPVEALKIVPAYRVDHIDGGFHNRADGSHAPAYNYGLIKQPKLSVSYDLGARTVAYANWGRTFQIGSGNGAFGGMGIVARCCDHVVMSDIGRATGRCSPSGALTRVS